MIIFGTAGYAKVLGVMLALCGRCHNHAQHHILKRGTKFSLFFIPLFPITGHYVLECSICGQGRQLTKAEAESLASSPAAPVSPSPGPQQGVGGQPQAPGGFTQDGPGHNPWGQHPRP